MQEIAGAVQEGASAYLTRQFKTLSIFAVITFFILFLLPAETTSEKIGRSIFFVVGAVFSGVTGYVGMWLAVRANVRVAAAAQATGEQHAMKIAFRSGGVAGMFTVGLVSLALRSSCSSTRGDARPSLKDSASVPHYSRCSCVLVAVSSRRLRTSVLTSSARSSRESPRMTRVTPPRSPTTSATTSATVPVWRRTFRVLRRHLGCCADPRKVAFGDLGLVIPLIIPAIGVITAILGIFTVSPRSGDRSGMTAINRGFFISAIISAVLVVIAAFVLLPNRIIDLKGVDVSRLGIEVTQLTSFDPRWLMIGAVLIGILLAAAMQVLTGYFTETNRKPVDDVAQSSLTGPATVILAGISLGLESAVYSALVIAAAVYGAFLLGGGSLVLSLFAIALAGTGLLTTVGVIVAMDTFGPISDNAQGIAEMSGDVDENGAQVLTNLDAVGNTTKAITKGIAIATAVLAATALFGSFRDAVGEAVASVQESSPRVLEGPRLHKRNAVPRHP